MAQLYWPFDQSRITEGYGWADWRQGIHDGIDFGVPQGTELRATASGVIRNNDAGEADGAGVDITTEDGWKVRHWHVSAFLLPNGTRVNAGDVIALSGGAKGTWGAGFSTGAHLHWGVRTSAGWVDPASLNPIPFGQPKPIQKKAKDMIVKVQCVDGFAALWNMTTGEYQHIDNPAEYKYFSELLEEFMFENEAHFVSIRDKYRKVFSV